MAAEVEEDDLLNFAGIVPANIAQAVTEEALDDGDSSDSSDYMADLDPSHPNRQKRHRAGQPRISQQIERMLGEANNMFVEKNYARSVELLTEVVRLAPHLPIAYNTLGLIYEQLGDMRKAVQFYIFAAHLSRDTQQWQRLGHLSRELGDFKQALYCYKRVFII